MFGVTMMRRSGIQVVNALIASAVIGLSAFSSGDAEAIGSRVSVEHTGQKHTAPAGDTSRRYAQRRGGRPGGGRPSAGRPGGGRPSAGRPGGDRNVNINRNVNVTVKHRGYGWRGARWGAVAFGVTMGAIITVAASTPPPPPHSSLCWTWTNSAKTTGYWYYCSGP